MNKISGIMVPLAAAATGFAGKSETSQAENVCACPCVLNLSGCFDRAGWKLQRAMRWEQRVDRERSWRNDRGNTDEKQQENKDRAPADSAD